MTKIIVEAAPGEPTQPRIARGTLPPPTDSKVQLALPISDAPPLRMTVKPPRFTTTTPGVLHRRLPR